MTAIRLVAVGLVAVTLWSFVTTALEPLRAIG